ncbi:hypothetical protein AOLI_G00016250 [Acnodon oligacanthus]
MAIKPGLKVLQNFPQIAMFNPVKSPFLLQKNKTSLKPRLPKHHKLVPLSLTWISCSPGSGIPYYCPSSPGSSTVGSPAVSAIGKASNSSPAGSAVAGPGRSGLPASLELALSFSGQAQTGCPVRLHLKHFMLVSDDINTVYSNPSTLNFNTRSSSSSPSLSTMYTILLKDTNCFTWGDLQPRRIFNHKSTLPKFIGFVHSGQEHYHSTIHA